MSLQRKVAIVTGAARGIGAGIVLALAKQGASVSRPIHLPSASTSPCLAF